MESHPPYPDIEPWDTGFLDVDPPHRLYWERVGTKGGIPAVHLHGGPAARCRRTGAPSIQRSTT